MLCQLGPLDQGTSLRLHLFGCDGVGTDEFGDLRVSLLHDALELLHIVRAKMHVFTLLDELLIRGQCSSVCCDSERTFCRVAKLSFNSSRSLRSAVRSSMSCSSRECAPSMFALAAESASRVAARLAA